MFPDFEHIQKLISSNKLQEALQKIAKRNLFSKEETQGKKKDNLVQLQVGINPN